MAIKETKIPIDPTDFKASLEAVLERIVFSNKNGVTLEGFRVESTTVTLKFEYPD